MPCWIAPRDVTVGSDYGEEVVEAIETSMGVVLLLSENSNRSRHVLNEVNTAFSEKKTIIPLSIENAVPSRKLKLFLKSAHRLDIDEVGLEHAIKKVVEAVQGGRPLFPPAPPFTKRKRKLRLPAVSLGAVVAVVFCALLAHEFTSDDPPILQGAALSPALRQQQLKEVLQLTQAGKTDEANRLMSKLTDAAGSDRLVGAVVDYLDSERRSKSRERLDRLIEHLDQRQASLTNATPAVAVADVRPRILACLGPTAKGVVDGSVDALLYRICLRAELQRMGTIQIVEREAIEDVVKELNLGSSALADSRAALTVGRLLPAGLLLLGDVVRLGDADKIYLRLIDTETTGVLAMIDGARGNDEDIADACAGLARQIAAKIGHLKPVRAPVLSAQGNRGNVAAGMFHGLVGGAPLDVVVRAAGDAGDGTRIGTATVRSVKETTAEIDMVFDGGRQPADGKGLWVFERAPAAP